MSPPTRPVPAGLPRRRHDAARPIAGGLDLPPQHLQLIDQSHQRCLALGVSRIERPDHTPLGRPDLNLARERNRRLFDHAAPVMEMLYEQIVNSQSMVVLTDASGTVLHSLGDDDFLGRARQVALAPGANWSEAAKGTNAVGTALIEEQPVLVHADEHYLHANHFLTCSAAPILDARGNILGVLDVSGDRGSYHPHTMALVTMSARMIENRWLTDDPRHLLRLHFHRRAEYIGTLKEGILAIGADGRIAGANRSALEQLGLAGSALRLQTLASLFGTGIGTLVDRFRASPASPLTVHDPEGRRFHLVARADGALWSGPVAVEPGPALDSTPVPRVRPPAPAAAAAAVPRPPAPALSAISAISALSALCTGDRQIERLVERIRLVRGRGIPILVLGETGTGKETLARAIHADFAHAAGPFVMLQGAAPTDPERDTATATAMAAAMATSLRQAEGGTLFVDEPGDWPPAQQQLLLRLLQDRQRRRAADGHPAGAAEVDLAIVSASREDPRHLVGCGRLREDLLQQLDGLSVRLPPLRERSDLAPLARALVAREAGAPPLSADVLALLGQHPWPGNLRQLHNVLRTACALAAGEDSIGREHLPEGFAAATPGGPSAATVAAPPRAPGHQGVRPLGDLQVEAIRHALAQCGGNITLASRRLGISRNTIYRRLRGAP